MRVQVKVEPADGLIDQPRHLSASGLAPGLATLAATLAHPDGSVWRSEAQFLIGGDGVLEVSHQAPVAGDWNTVDGMAWVWAMRQLREPTLPQATEGIAPLSLTVTVADAQGREAVATAVQRFLGEGVSRREVREQGLSGTLFTPAGPGPYPLVVVLNGSGGGTPEQRAALYAAQGYQSVALAYFKAPGRPDHISDTPLEYFDGALAWAGQALNPKHDFIALAGLSRGGELALLLGARFPERVSAVIGYVPSAVVHGTLRAGRPDQPRDAPAWTWQGQPLHTVWHNNPHADWRAFDTPPAPGAAIRQAPAFSAVEQHAEAVAAARIPVEHIAGPVLLISGTDDGFWPSTRYCERIMADLQAAGHPWPVEHSCTVGAGHAIGFPYVPTTVIARPHPVAKVLLSGGGTAQANAQASRDSWAHILRFLAQAVADKGRCA